eukprot:4179895-Prorocentrum_lima.AAC.1
MIDDVCIENEETTLGLYRRNANSSGACCSPALTLGSPGFECPTWTPTTLATIRAHSVTSSGVHL